MKKKYLIISFYAILIIVIGCLIRYIYINELKTIDADLRNVATLFIFSNNFYERNKHTLSSEELQDNLTQNDILINNIELRYYKKEYLPKYKLKLIQDIKALMYNIQYYDSGSEGYRLAYETLGKVGFELQRIESTGADYPEIGENEYKQIKNIILEYDKYVNSLPKE